MEFKNSEYFLRGLVGSSNTINIYVLSVDLDFESGIDVCCDISEKFVNAKKIKFLKKLYKFS